MAFTKDTALYNLIVGIKEGLHSIVSLPFPATLLWPYLCYRPNLSLAKDNGHACLFNSVPDAIHLGRFSGHGVIHVDNVVVFALDSWFGPNCANVTIDSFSISFIRPFGLQVTHNGYPGIKHIGERRTLAPSLAASLIISIVFLTPP